jgi:hypothetical protein
MTPNPKYYGTMLACQALKAAGIVMETEAVHTIPYVGKPYLQYKILIGTEYGEQYVLAPNMSELWRELPEEKGIDTCICDLTICKNGDITFASYCWYQEALIQFKNTNPCDALAELLIWVKGEKK